jgi:hypothetical protein
MVNPVPGYSVTTPYGKKPNNNTYWQACGFHTGADFAAPEGTWVVASISGDLRVRNYGPAFGIQCAISPDPGDPFADGEVFYAHLSWLDPNLINKRVEAGQRIGKVGSTGGDWGPHLHYEQHTVKTRWGCDVVTDPMPSILWSPQHKWAFPSGTKVYLSYLKVDGHLANSDGWSQSIKCLQEMLNVHLGCEIPLIGKFGPQTDECTRECQDLHLPPADPAGKSFVGPKQGQHLIDVTKAPYVLEDDRETTPEPDPTQPVIKPWPAKALVTLRQQVDQLYPGRDKATDGWIGDLAHCGPGAPPSEHCPDEASEPPGVVRALDIDADLVPGEARGESQRLADMIVDAGRAGDKRLWYVIHNGVIRSVTYGWVDRPYTGSNPHESHIHVSFKPEGDQNGTPFVLKTEPEPEPEPTPTEVTREEFDALKLHVDALDTAFKNHRHETEGPK